MFLRLQHLLTFSLQDGDVQGVEEAQARLSFLAQHNKLWSQQMFLDVGAEAIQLRDIQSLVRTQVNHVTLIFRRGVTLLFHHHRMSWRPTPSSPSIAAMQSTQKNTSHRSFCLSAKAPTRRSRTSIFSIARQ